jgi:hypothetical protein
MTDDARTAHPRPSDAPARAGRWALVPLSAPPAQEVTARDATPRRPGRGLRVEPATDQVHLQALRAPDPPPNRPCPDDAEDALQHARGASNDTIDHTHHHIRP